MLSLHLYSHSQLEAWLPPHAELGKHLCSFPSWMLGGMLFSPIPVLSRPPENLSAFLGQGTWVCDIPALPLGIHLSISAAAFKKWGCRGFPGGPLVGDMGTHAADRVQSLGGEDPTGLVATKPVLPNYWARALKPTSHNYWSHAPQLRSLWAYSLWSRTREATAMRNPHITMKSSPAHCNKGKPHEATKTQHSQSKIHVFFKKVRVEPDSLGFGSKSWFYQVLAVFLCTSHSASLGFTFLISKMGIMLSSGGFPSLTHSTVNYEYPSQASVPCYCHGLHSDLGSSARSRGCAWLGRNYYF